MPCRDDGVKNHNFVSESGKGNIPNKFKMWFFLNGKKTQLKSPKDTGGCTGKATWVNTLYKGLDLRMGS